MKTAGRGDKSQLVAFGIDRQLFVDYGLISSIVALSEPLRRSLMQHDDLGY